MPGIVGLITKMPRQQAEAQLSRMIKTMRHELFYTTGTWVEESLGIYVGWAVRKNSFADGLPIFNDQKNVALVFSGEDYPDPDIISRLRQKGHAVQAGECSYLERLYEEDPSFPAALNGRFHGLIADQVRKKAVLFNDRYGMERLYYHESKDAFYFAAEAKAILAVRPELRRADPRGLGEFIACGCVMEDRTIFEGIRVLPGGSAWVFQDASILQKNVYFRPAEWEHLSALDPESYYEQLRAAFSKNLPRYSIGREQVGIALTGGLDTRAIMAWWKAPPNSLPCYTFRGPYRDCQDVLLARRVANICGQPHQAITIGQEYLANFAHYAQRSVYLTDACVEIGSSPDLYISERARAIAPAKIVGTFGSEVLRHLAMFKPVMPLEGLYTPELLIHIQKAADIYHNLRRQHPVTFAVFRQFPWYHYGVFAHEQSQLTVRSPYLDNDFVRIVYRAPKLDAESTDVRGRLIRDGNSVLAALRSDRGVRLGPNGFPPLISRTFLEFTFKAEYAYDYGMPQWVAKIDHLFSPLRMERLFLGRHKVFHFRIWYRDILCEYVREMLLDHKTLSRPYLNRTAVEHIVRGHLHEGKNFTVEIHKLLTLELLHRLFLDAA